MSAVNEPSNRQLLRKADHISITPRLLNLRVKQIEAMGYTKQKWIMFCESMLEHGFELSLYEARKTLSKYITVRKKNKSYKVRFSNHKPIKQREMAADCDFFVGVTHTGWRTTDDAIKATLEFFKG